MDMLKKIGIWLGIIVGIVTVAAFWTNIPTKNDMYRGDDNLQKSIKEVDVNLQKQIKEVDVNLQKQIKEVDEDLQESIRRVEENLQTVEENLQKTIIEVEANLREEMKSRDASINREMQAIREEMNKGFNNITAMFELYLQESKELRTDVRANTQNHVNHLERHEEIVASERESKDD